MWLKNNFVEYRNWMFAVLFMTPSFRIAARLEYSDMVRIPPGAEQRKRTHNDRPKAQPRLENLDFSAKCAENEAFTR